MLVMPETEMIYIDIPKTASSTLEQYLRARNGGHMFSTDKKFSKHCRDLPDRINVHHWKKIISVRNPYDRITSHYFYHIKRKVMDQIVPGCHPSEHSDENLDRFIDYHLSILSEDSATRNQSIYRLFPIWKYVEPIGYDVYIRTENLLTDLLKNNIIWEHPENGIPAIPKINAHSHPSWKEIETQERKEKIQEWARNDFEDFGYER